MRRLLGDAHADRVAHHPLALRPRRRGRAHAERDRRQVQPVARAHPPAPGAGARQDPQAHARVAGEGEPPSRQAAVGTALSGRPPDRSNRLEGQGWQIRGAGKGKRSQTASSLRPSIGHADFVAAKRDATPARWSGCDLVWSLRPVHGPAGDEVDEPVGGVACAVLLAAHMVEEHRERDGAVAPFAEHVAAEGDHVVERAGLGADARRVSSWRKRPRSVPSTPPIESCATYSGWMSGARHAAAEEVHDARGVTRFASKRPEPFLRTTPASLAPIAIEPLPHELRRVGAPARVGPFLARRGYLKIISA